MTERHLGYVGIAAVRQRFASGVICDRTNENLAGTFANFRQNMRHCAKFNVLHNIQADDHVESVFRHYRVFVRRYVKPFNSHAWQICTNIIDEMAFAATVI